MAATGLGWSDLRTAFAGVFTAPAVDEPSETPRPLESLLSPSDDVGTAVDLLLGPLELVASEDSPVDEDELELALLEQLQERYGDDAADWAWPLAQLWQRVAEAAELTR